MFRAVSWCLLAMCAVVFSERAYGAGKEAVAAKDAGNAHAGQTLFMSKCFQCHSVTEGEVRFGPSLYHEVKKPKPKKTEAEVRAIIKNGKNKMPAWGAILSQEDTDNLLAYIKTL